MTDFQYEHGRIFATDAAGNMVAEVLFPDITPGMADIRHTFVDESLRGRGIAGKLMEAVAAQLRREHKRAVLTCPYAIRWFREHPEYGDILADGAK